MPKYHVEIGGKKYEVDAANPELAAQAAHQFTNQGAKPTGVAKDMLRSLGAGVTQGIAGMGSIPGDLDSLGNRGLAKLVSKFGIDEKAAFQGLEDVRRAFPAAPLFGSNLTTTENLQSTVGAKHTLYAPQTVAGEYTRTAGQFLPGALIPGSGAARVANVLAPAMASETAGQVAREVAPQYEAAARMAGGLAGGLAAPRVVSSLTPRPVIAPKPMTRVAGAVDRTLTRDAMTPAQARQVLADNPGAMPAQVLGENFAAMSEVAAKSPGPARTTIRNAVDASQAAAPGRIKADIGAGLGGKGDYFETLDQMQTQRKNVALPYRDKAFSTPIKPEAYEATVSPVIARVPQSALKYGEKIANLEGTAQTELGFAADGTVAMQPSMKGLHYIKKGLDQELEAFRNPVTGRLDTQGNPLAAALAKTRSDLGKAMRDVDPNYDKFMQTWGDESGHIDAMRLGRDVFKPSVNVEQLSARVADMNPAELDAFRKGSGEALMDMVRNEGAGGVATMRKMLRTENNGAKLRLAFNDEAAFGNFMDSANKRVAEQARNNRLTGGSPTEPLRQARADLDAQPIGALDVAGGTLDVLGANLPALGQRALKALPRQDRSIIGNPQLNQILGDVASDPAAMQNLLDILDQISARNAGRPPFLLPNPAAPVGAGLGLLSGNQ